MKGGRSELRPVRVHPWSFLRRWRMKQLLRALEAREARGQRGDAEEGR